MRWLTMVQSQQSIGKVSGASGMRRRSPEIRKFQLPEYERFVQIRSSVFPEDPLSALELKSFDDNLDRTKYYLKRYSCFDKETGEMVGLGDLSHFPWMFSPGRFRGRIWVNRDHQNQGVGQFIYEYLRRCLADLKAAEVWGFEIGRAHV